MIDDAHAAILRAAHEVRFLTVAAARGDAALVRAWWYYCAERRLPFVSVETGDVYCYVLLDLRTARRQLSAACVAELRGLARVARMGGGVNPGPWVITPDGADLPAVPADLAADAAGLLLDIALRDAPPAELPPEVWADVDAIVRQSWYGG